MALRRDERRQALRRLPVLRGERPAIRLEREPRAVVPHPLLNHLRRDTGTGEQRDVGVP